MKISVLFFASLREAVGMEQEHLELPESINSIRQLKDYLALRGDPWREQFSTGSPILASVNQNMVNDKALLHDNDEVAFFPPVTGG